MLDILLWVVSLTLILLGLAGTLLPLLPGIPLLFLGMLLGAWIDDFSRVGGWSLMILAVLGAVAWLLDYLASVWGVKKSGASGLAMVGAGLGALVGIFAGLPGLILGPILGALAGEYYASRSHGSAARAGFAAGLGFILAAVIKLAVAFTMTAIFAMDYFSG